MRRENVAKVTLLVAMGQLFCAWGDAQELDFRGWEDRPGLYFYLVQPAPLWDAGVLSVERSPVRDHVRGDHALRLTFRATPGAAGLVVYRPPGFAVASRAPYRAISFWVKGDGSEGIGVVGIGEGGSADPRASFLLKSRSWQPVRLEWRGFDRPVAGPRIPSVFFGVTPETKRPVAYLIDRIELVRSADADDEDDEVREAGAKAAKLADVPRPTDLTAFVARRGGLANVRGLLDAKRPTRILVIGDAVAQGAGLWNVPAGVRGRYLFWGVLERELKRKAPETTVVPVFVEGPTAAAAGIEDALRRLNPDLVIVQLSSSAPGMNRTSARSRAREADRAIFAACRRTKTDVIALGIPALPGQFRRANQAADLLAEAARAGVPAADFGGLAAARGKGFQGEYYATPDQLNVQGHLLAAKLLASSLTRP